MTHSRTLTEGDVDAEREAAFRSLFAAHHRAILGYAMRRTGSTNDAADVLAETMLVAWRRLDTVPSGDGARLWLYGVAHKVLANHLRGVSRRQKLAERLAGGLDSALADSTEPYADQLWVRAALAALEDTDREVLTLTAWEGLSPAEIAEALGLPPATIRTRLHRARARLRTELDATSGNPKENR